MLLAGATLLGIVPAAGLLHMSSFTPKPGPWTDPVIIDKHRGKAKVGRDALVSFGVDIDEWNPTSGGETGYLKLTALGIANSRIENHHVILGADEDPK